MSGTTASLPLQNFDQYVQTAAAAMQTSSDALLDFGDGSVLLALLEGVTGQTLWLQFQNFLVLQQTRLATSSGSAVDSFGADFSFSRLPASYAQGTVTFSRYVADTSAFIPVGATVVTSDGTQTYTVVADASQSSYSTTQLGYVVPVGTLSANATVEAVNPGTQGNVAANSIALLQTNIPGITSVTNPTLLSGGVNAESDAAFKLRFANYIQTRYGGTLLAYQYAIQSVQQGLTYNIAENTAPNGAFQPGYCTITVDDGSGNPPGALLATVSEAVNAVRAVGSTFGVFGPSVVEASISMTITAMAGYQKSALQGPVSAAISAYVNALGVGVALPYSILSKLAYDSTPGIANVTQILLNGGTADIGGGPTQSVRISSIAVN